MLPSSDLGLVGEEGGKAGFEELEETSTLRQYMGELPSVLLLELLKPSPLHSLPDES